MILSEDGPPPPQGAALYLPVKKFVALDSSDDDESRAGGGDRHSVRPATDHSIYLLPRIATAKSECLASSTNSSSGVRDAIVTTPGSDGNVINPNTKEVRKGDKDNSPRLCVGYVASQNVSFHSTDTDAAKHSHTHSHDSSTITASRRSLVNPASNNLRDDDRPVLLRSTLAESCSRTRHEENQVSRSLSSSLSQPHTPRKVCSSHKPHVTTRRRPSVSHTAGHHSQMQYWRKSIADLFEQTALVDAPIDDEPLRACAERSLSQKAASNSGNSHKNSAKSGEAVTPGHKFSIVTHTADETSLTAAVKAAPHTAKTMTIYERGQLYRERCADKLSRTRALLLEAEARELTFHPHISPPARSLSPSSSHHAAAGQPTHDKKDILSVDERRYVRRGSQLVPLPDTHSARFNFAPQLSAKSRRLARRARTASLQPMDLSINERLYRSGKRGSTYIKGNNSVHNGLSEQVSCAVCTEKDTSHLSKRRTNAAKSSRRTTATCSCCDTHGAKKNYTGPLTKSQSEINAHIEQLYARHSQRDHTLQRIRLEQERERELATMPLFVSAHDVVQRLTHPRHRCHSSSHTLNATTQTNKAYDSGNGTGMGRQHDTVYIYSTSTHDAQRDRNYNFEKHKGRIDRNTSCSSYCAKKENCNTTESESYSSSTHNENNTDNFHLHQQSQNMPDDSITSYTAGEKCTDAARRALRENGRVQRAHARIARRWFDYFAHGRAELHVRQLTSQRAARNTSSWQEENDMDEVQHKVKGSHDVCDDVAVAHISHAGTRSTCTNKENADKLCQQGNKHAQCNSHENGQLHDAYTCSSIGHDKLEPTHAQRERSQAQSQPPPPLQSTSFSSMNSDFQVYDAINVGRAIAHELQRVNASRERWSLTDYMSALLQSHAIARAERTASFSSPFGLSVLEQMWCCARPPPGRMPSHLIYTHTPQINPTSEYLTRRARHSLLCTCTHNSVRPFERLFLHARAKQLATQQKMLETEQDRLVKETENYDKLRRAKNNIRDRVPSALPKHSIRAHTDALMWQTSPRTTRRTCSETSADNSDLCVNNMRTYTHRRSSLSYMPSSCAAASSLQERNTEVAITTNANDERVNVNSINTPSAQDRTKYTNNTRPQSPPGTSGAREQNKHPTRVHRGKKESVLCDMSAAMKQLRQQLYHVTNTNSDAYLTLNEGHAIGVEVKLPCTNRTKDLLSKTTRLM